MKKKILKTTFFLMIFSGISKFLSFVIRLFIARILSEEAVSYYSLASPVLMFLISLSNFGIPNALTQLVASKKDIQPSISAAILLSLANNVLLIILCILAIPLYAHFILKQDVLIPVFYACVPMLPMVMITGLFKGYFMGRQKMLFASSAQITEEVFRLAFLLLFYPSFSSNPVIMASFVLFSQTVGEIGSCLHLSISLLFKQRRKLIRSIVPEFQLSAIIEILSLSVPMTAARMSGSLTAFLEPVIMLNATASSMKQAFISTYSHLNTYVLPLITLPSFFSIALSGWVLPAFAQAYGAANKAKARSIFFFSTLFSLIAGTACSLLLFCFSEPICLLLYQKTEMAELLRFLSLPFALYAAQPVLTCILHGAQKSTRALIDTLCGCLVRLISLFVLCRHSVVDAAAIALILSSLSTTLLHLQACLALFFNQNHTALRPKRNKNL